MWKPIHIIDQGVKIPKNAYETKLYIVALKALAGGVDSGINVDGANDYA